MPNLDDLDIDTFLTDYPEMSLHPISGDEIRIAGTFQFSADHAKHGKLTDKFELSIDIPSSFPRSLPTVWEIGKRIPRNNDHHINRGGSLCLGSPLRLLEIINCNPTLPHFVEQCLIPWLYAMSKKLAGGDFVFGELAHYGEGLLDDYVTLFHLKTPHQARSAIELLTIKKRVANKRDCPCECGQRLGRCSLRLRLLKFRKLTSRKWFRKQLGLVNS